MSDKSIYFAMGFHNHQPVGNFDSVFDLAYEKSYMPFIECVERHPSIKVVLHNTGPLWDMYLNSRPKWIEKIRRLVKRGQLEILSGGYYEPILVNISDRDKISQIKMMNRIVKRETSYKPRGMWCAERVWEPGLAKPISLSDMKYTILDESHFRFAGLKEEEMFGYYVTEDQGYPLSVVPINQSLRHMIPSAEPEDIIRYLKDCADEGKDKLAVFADDGEKFGLWPGSYETVWEQGWMDRFFELLEENQKWIKTITISEYMDEYLPLGRIYLPTASYSEMTQWALPTEAGKLFHRVIKEVKENGQWDLYRDFLKGGFWRNFLVKYPEANRIQKKALYISEKVHRMVTKDKHLAEVELFKGQCNCPYWHGVFGGIYLPNLRHGVQQCLIKAEKLADDEFHKGNPYKEIECLDINRDLCDEIIINTTNLQMAFSPDMGGGLYELNYKPLNINMADTITRREEVYHDLLRKKAGQIMDATDFQGIENISKEKDLHNYLVRDPYQRLCFLDHFINETENIESFCKGDFQELGNFIEEPYEVFTSFKDDMAILTLSRKGLVESQAIEIEKTFMVLEDGNGFRVQYWIINNSNEKIDFIFAPEINFSFLSKDVETNYIMAEHTEVGEDGEPYSHTGRYPFEKMKNYENLNRITLRDGHRKYQISVNLGQEAGVWTFPIETVSISDEGYERVFQSVVVVPKYKISLEPGDSWDNLISINIDGITKYENEKTVEVDMEGF